MAKKRADKRLHPQKEVNNKPDYRIEFEKLKVELDEHEKNMEILKKQIRTLKKVIKLGSISNSENAPDTFSQQSE